MVRIEAYVPSNSPRLIGKTTSQWIVKGEGYSISEFKAGWKGPWGSRSEKVGLDTTAMINILYSF